MDHQTSQRLPCFEAGFLPQATAETDNGLGLLSAWWLGIGSKTLRDKIGSIFDTRNGLVHGKRKLATNKEAKDAIKYSEKLLDAIMNFEDNVSSEYND